MFLKQIELKEKKENNLSIDLNDEYSYMDYYRENTSDYNYIKRKYSSSSSKSGKYVGLYIDGNEKLGYFYVSCRISQKPIYKYSSYTRYVELLEFGFNNNNLDQINFLLNYLIEYTSIKSCCFIQIKTKEKSFDKFYELLRKFPHTEDSNYIYLDVNPINYEFLTHIISYDTDNITIKDLYHLYSLGFKIEQDFCKFTLYDNDSIIVNRHTKEITYPSRIVNMRNKFKKLNTNSYSLIHLIINNNYKFANKKIIIDYKIKNFNFKLIKVDNELFSFDKELYDNKILFLNFALIAFRKLDFISIYFCNQERFKLQTLYSSLGTLQINLPNYIEKNKR